MFCHCHGGQGIIFNGVSEGEKGSDAYHELWHGRSARFKAIIKKGRISPGYHAGTSNDGDNKIG